MHLSFTFTTCIHVRGTCMYMYMYHYLFNLLYMSCYVRTFVLQFFVFIFYGKNE